MSKLSFEGNVQPSGILKVAEHHASLWSIVLRSLAGKRVYVTIEEWKRQRTLSQNAWYWSVIVPFMAQELTHRGRKQYGGDWNLGLPLSPEQAHVLLKKAFLGVVQTPLGEVPRDSHDLTTVEFSKYCEDILAFAASEWGLTIPTPHENRMEV